MKNQILSNLAKDYFKYKNKYRHLSVSKDGKKRFDLAEGLWSKNKIAQLPDRNSSQLKKVLAIFLGIKPENISVFAGADEIIEIIPRLYLNPKQRVMVIVPTFERLITTNIKAGAKVVSFKLNQETNFKLEESNASKLIEIVSKDSTKLVWICTPNNPTGQTINLGVIEKIARSVPKSLVIINEVYQEYFSLDNKDSAVSLINKFPNLIVIRSFSKAFGLAGVRVGYVVADSEIISQFENFRTMYNLSSYAHDYAVSALSPESLTSTRAALNRISKEKEKLIEHINNLSNFEVVASKTNFIFLRHKNKDLFDELYIKGFVVSDWREALE